jgi:hypothetical protein
LIKIGGCIEQLSDHQLIEEKTLLYGVGFLPKVSLLMISCKLNVHNIVPKHLNCG